MVGPLPSEPGDTSSFSVHLPGARDWPFSRLVHAWSYPLWYLWRPYVVYRRRRAVPPPEPGTGGRKWRRIGVPY